MVERPPRTEKTQVPFPTLLNAVGGAASPRGIMTGFVVTPLALIYILSVTKVHGGAFVKVKDIFLGKKRGTN